MDTTEVIRECSTCAFEKRNGSFEPCRTCCFSMSSPEWQPKLETTQATVQTDTSAMAVQIGGAHYKDMAIQPLEYIMANGIPFPEGNVIKYVSRWRKKNGLEDLKKARHMLDTIIEGAEKGTYK